MQVNSVKYKGVSYKYQRENETLYIYTDDTVIMQIKFAFDERFTARTLQYFGDMFFEALHSRLNLIETACHTFIENNLFDYDEAKMWRNWS